MDGECTTPSAYGSSVAAFTSLWVHYSPEDEAAVSGQHCSRSAVAYLRFHLWMCMQQEHAAGLDCMPWLIMSVRLPTGLHVLFLYGCFAVLQVHLCCRVTALGSTALAAPRPG